MKKERIANIVLTGFMGTGKSEVGKRLARALGWRFLDTDELIEKEIGIKIAEIFARNGEPYFRDLETKTVRLVSLLDEAVISCGGGVVLREENMEELEKNGFVVCLTASPEKIFERTQRDGGRPLLAVKDPLARIRELLAAREPFYRRCHIAIDTSEMTPQEIVDKILRDPRAAL